MWIAHLKHITQSTFVPPKGLEISGSLVERDLRLHAMQDIFFLIEFVHVWKALLCADVTWLDSTYSYAWHDSCICVTWLIHMCDMTHSIRVWHNSCIFVWYDSFVRVTWLVIMCDMTHTYVWEVWFIRVTNDKTHAYACDMTYSYAWHDSLISVWHDSFICVTWLMHTCVTWHVYMCDTSHAYVWHDSFIYVAWLIHMYDKTPAYECDMSRSYSSHDSLICVTWHIYINKSFSRAVVLHVETFTLQHPHCTEMHCNACCHTLQHVL